MREGEVIEVRKNETFTIAMDSNPTTGYRWETTFNKGSIELVGKSFKPSSERIGAGGEERFEFRAREKGEIKVEMICKRPWEERPINTKTFVIRVR